MATIAIEITDELSGWLTKLGDVSRNPRFLHYLGDALADRTREHLYAKNQEPNKMGASKTGFFMKAADGTHFTVIEGGVQIHIVGEVGLRQRYLGGEIKPTQAKALTIPVHPDARGKRARHFGNGELVFVPSQAGGNTIGVLGRKVDGSDFLEAYYILKRRVRQKGDPTVLPASRVLLLAASDAAEEWLAEFSRTGGEN